MVHGMKVDRQEVSRCETMPDSPRRCAVGLAWLLGGALASLPVRAEAEPVSVAEGALRVDVAAGIQGAAKLPQRIADRHPELARQLAEGPGRERWIAVEIGGEYLDFRYRVVPMRDGEALGGAGEWVVCKCSNDELLDAIGEKLPAAVERLREPLASREEPEPQEGPSEPEPQPEPQSPAPRHRKMTELGTAGIAVGAVGVSGVVVGAVFMGLGQRRPADRLELERDYRPPGVAFLVSGGVVLGAGLAMLVTDIVQCRRGHARCLVEPEEAGLARGARSRSASISPWLGARWVGISGRF